MFRACLHLAYLTPEEFDELNAALDRRNAGSGRKARPGTAPRAGVPRRCTRFPERFARCWYCGSHVVWGENGAKDNLMWNWHCWNSVGFGDPLAAERIVASVARELTALEGFAARFAALVREADESAP